MAWNYYKFIRRKVGCDLRICDLPLAVTGIVPEGYLPVRVEVAGRERGKATLRVWSSPNGHMAVSRFVVDIVVLDEDPNWIVERY